MATFYIQFEDRLQKISGDLTHNNIIKALGYTPSNFSGNFNDLEDNPLTQDGNGEFKIVDESGNIIAIVNSEGIHSIDFIAGDHKLSDKADKNWVTEFVTETVTEGKVNLDGYATESWVENKGYAKQEDLDNIDFNTLKNTPFSDDENGELNIVDENNNIGLRLNSDGLYVKDVIADGHTLSQKADKSDIPSLDGYATESYVNTELENYATKEDIKDIASNSTIIELSGKVSTLIGEDADKSVRDIAVDVLTETLVSETATEAYDTLAEMSAWIKSHPEDAAAMNIAIQKNATDITNLDSAYKAADAKILTDAQEYTDNINFFTIKDNPIVDNNDGNLTFVDESGNIGLQFSNNAILVNDVITPEHTLSNKADKSELTEKQDTLVSGTNIKTVNGQSLLGNGDLEIQEFKTYTFDWNNRNETITQEELNEILESDKIYIKNNTTLVEITVKNESDSYLSLIGYNNSLDYVTEYHINIDKNNLTLFMIIDCVDLVTDSELEDLTNSIHYNVVECSYIEDGLILEGQDIIFDAGKITVLMVVVTSNESNKAFYLRSNAIDANTYNYNFSVIFYGRYTDTSLLKATYNQKNQTLTFNIIEQSGGNIDLSNYATEDYVNQKEQAIQTWVNNKEFATQEDVANIDFYDIKDNPIINNGDGKLIFADEQGNIGLQLEADNTLYVKDVVTSEHTLSNKADKSELPTKTSDLTNDSGFITIEDIPVLEIPEEYVTDDELSQKGFLVGEETSEELDDVETNTYVKYVAQTLTDEQKAQARNNIGAPSMEQLMAMYQELLSMINNSQNQAPTVATLDKSVLDNTKLA